MLFNRPMSRRVGARHARRYSRRVVRPCHRAPGSGGVLPRECVRLAARWLAWGAVNDWLAQAKNDGTFSNTIGQTHAAIRPSISRAWARSR